MSTVTIQQAADIVDRFEQLLAGHGISIPRHAQTGADMLPFWMLLEKLKTGGLQPSSPENREVYRAALSVHDLAVKVLTVGLDPQIFARLHDHLALLANGAIHLTQEPPASADSYNKLIELYWACLLYGCGVHSQLDPPKTGSTGVNPDVISLDSQNAPMCGYAFKTIRSPHTESIRQHIVKGVSQIEVSPAPTGIVALHLTPRLAWGSRWPDDMTFFSYTQAATIAIDQMRAMLGQLITDNGQAAIDSIFAGKKAVGRVLCIAFIPIVATNPLTSTSTFMPVKIAAVISLATNDFMPHSLSLELWSANEIMQTRTLI